MIYRNKANCLKDFFLKSSICAFMGTFVDLEDLPAVTLLHFVDKIGNLVHCLLMPTDTANRTPGRWHKAKAPWIHSLLAKHTTTTTHTHTATRRVAISQANKPKRAHSCRYIQTWTHTGARWMAAWCPEGWAWVAQRAEITFGSQWLFLTNTTQNTHTNVSHTRFLAIKPSSSQYMPWLRGGWLQMAVQLSTIPPQPNNSLAVKWQEWLTVCRENDWKWDNTQLVGASFKSL